MSEENFYQNMREQLVNFSPEVPSKVYEGMRRKYAVSKFFSWNLNAFNVWYLTALMTITGVTAFQMRSFETKADRGINPLSNIIEMEVPVNAMVATTIPTESMEAKEKSVQSCSPSAAASCSQSSTEVVQVESPSSIVLEEKRIEETQQENMVIEEIQVPVKEEQKIQPKKTKRLTVPVIKDNK